MILISEVNYFFKAELRGKLPSAICRMEDVLTSNVFSFFKYASRVIFLKRYLESINIQVTEEEAKDATFHFWPTYADNTEPDLVIIVGDFYLLFEAKYFSGFGSKTDKIEAQLVRQINGGILEASTYKKKFLLIAITADHVYRPSIIDDIPEEVHHHLVWTNWQNVAAMLNISLNSNTKLKNSERLFAEDLYLLLDKKHLRDFQGTDVIKNYLPELNSYSNVFFQAEKAKYRGDFFGFSSNFIVEEPIRQHDAIFYHEQQTDILKLLNKIKIEQLPNIIFFRRDRND